MEASSQVCVPRAEEGAMSWCEDYIDPFPRDCEHGVPDGINCNDCVDEGMEDDQDDFNIGVYIDQD